MGFQHAENELQLFVAPSLGHLAERGAPRFIVRAVEPQLGALGHETSQLALRKALQPRRPFDAAHALGESLARYRNRAETFDRGEGGAGIVVLMCSEEARRRQVEGAPPAI